MKIRTTVLFQIILLLICLNLKSQISEIDCKSFFSIVTSRQNIIEDTIDQIFEESEMKEELYGRWEWFWRDRVDKNGEFAQYHYNLKEIFKKNLRSYLKSAPSISWTSLGPDEEPTPNISRLTGVAQATSIWANSSTIYVGLQGGGLWERDGSSWTNLTSDLPCFSVFDIAVDNSGKIYIATGYKAQGGSTWVNEGYGYGVFYSTDGGDTWVTDGMSSVPDEDLLIKRILIHPTDQDTVYALSRFTVYKSVNGGDDW